MIRFAKQVPPQAAAHDGNPSGQQVWHIVIHTFGVHYSASSSFCDADTAAVLYILL